MRILSSFEHEKSKKREESAKKGEEREE